jgi:general secretion pathway protein E
VSSSLLAVVAQRLVRRLCKHCRVPYEISDAELRELSLNPAQITTRQAFRPGNGDCPHCQGSGYSGRLGIHELLIIDDEVRSQILQRLDSNSIKNSAVRRGFATLRADGGKKVLAGLTTVEEVLLASHDDVI